MNNANLFVLFVQVKSGTIFDNFLISDDVKEAEEFGKETWGATKVGLYLNTVCIAYIHRTVNTRQKPPKIFS